MVPLLVLGTFVLFITVDVLLHREKYRFRVAEAGIIPGSNVKSWAMVRNAS